jgi:hypothetical protein
MDLYMIYVLRTLSQLAGSAISQRQPGRREQEKRRKGGKAEADGYRYRLVEEANLVLAWAEWDGSGHEVRTKNRPVLAVDFHLPAWIPGVGEDQVSTIACLRVDSYLGGFVFLDSCRTHARRS